MLVLALFQCEKESAPEEDGTGDKVFTGNIHIGSRTVSEELTEFFDKGYVVITGNLNITDSRAFDLSLLSNIEKIEGFVTISDYTLTSISFLQNLRYVGGSFELTAFRLRSLEPLKNLNHIGGRFRLSIEETNTITSFDSLEHLGGLQFDGCANPHPFLFPGVRSLNLLSIEYCTFESLHGLEAIETLGELVIKKCDQLKVLTGLNRIDSVENLAILNNKLLLDLSGIESIRYLNRFILHGNTSLSSLSGLQKLKFLGYIGISENEILADYCDLPIQINNGDYIGYWSYANGYDPTIEQLIAGKCKSP